MFLKNRKNISKMKRSKVIDYAALTRKASITNAVDNKFQFIKIKLYLIEGLIFHVSHLLADNSHEISCLICSVGFL